MASSPGTDRIDRAPFLEQRHHDQPTRGERVVAEELRRLQLGDEFRRQRGAATEFPAARAVSRCCTMAASNPAMSTTRPRSRAMSAVRSTGKP
jgi:hypothetical protein